VYPTPKAVALAEANNTPMPSMPAELAENTTKPAATLADPPVVALRQVSWKAQKPTEEEVEMAEVFVVPEVRRRPLCRPLLVSGRSLVLSACCLLDYSAW